MRKLPPVYLALLLFVCLTSCSYRFRIDATPPDAITTLNGNSVQAGVPLVTHARSVTINARREGYADFAETFTHPFWLGEKAIVIEMEKLRYPVEVSILGQSTAFTIDGTAVSAPPFTGELEYGPHHLAVERPGGAVVTIDWTVTGPGRYTFRPQTAPSALSPVGVFECGTQPKQVLFSPDSREVFITLLDGKGFQQLDLSTRTIRTIEPAEYASLVGFVEAIIIPRGNEQRLLVSQMTTARLHELRLTPNGGTEYLRSFKTGGVWPKVIAWLPGQDVLAVSNWLSNDVTILDYESAHVLHTLGGLNVPRGLAFSPDGTALVVASFGGGFLAEYDTSSWERTRTLQRPAGAALRHVVASRDGAFYFVSDMGRNEVMQVDRTTFEVVHVYPTGPNPNTVDLSLDARLLAVSCRGPNNPLDYTLRSPAAGSVLIFDTSTGTLLATIEAGFQPTGLDISPDDRLLAFSNFQDASVEVYSLEGIRK
jgi:DNA-binding beta-propeller fold protein YncE